jgi:hypothetical protein
MVAGLRKHEFGAFCFSHEKGISLTKEKNALSKCKNKNKKLT